MPKTDDIMIDQMRQYYLEEKGIAIPAYIAAGLMLLLGLLLYFKYGHNALCKSMGIGFLVIAALGLVVGIAATTFNNNKLAELETRVTIDDLELRTLEMRRVDKVMNVTFRDAFIAFGVLMLVAMAVIILTRSDHWRGLGIALMVLIALLTVFDSFNAQRNKAYLEAITTYPDPAPVQ